MSLVFAKRLTALNQTHCKLHALNVSLVLLALSALTFSGIQSAQASTYAPRFYVADGRFSPGEVHQLTYSGRAGYQAARIHRRAPASHSMNATPIRAIGSFAVGPRGELYVCSGVDRCIYRVRGGREELVHVHLPARVGEGIRDVALGNGGDTLYYSVVRTPQGCNDALRDGMIYGISTRNLQRGRPASNKAWDFYRVRQADVGRDWWGTFDVSDDGQLYLSTLGDYFDVYHVQGGRPRILFSSGQRIESFTVVGRTLYYTDGDTSIFRCSLDRGGATLVSRLPDGFTFRDIRVAYGPQRR